MCQSRPRCWASHQTPLYHPHTVLSLWQNQKVCVNGRFHVLGLEETIITWCEMKTPFFTLREKMLPAWITSYTTLEVAKICAICHNFYCAYVSTIDHWSWGYNIKIGWGHCNSYNMVCEFYFLTQILSQYMFLILELSLIFQMMFHIVWHYVAYISISLSNHVGV